MTTHTVIYDIMPTEPPADKIEENLQTIVGELTLAWRTSQCLTCPLGELAALAAATLVFYRENRR